MDFWNVIADYALALVDGVVKVAYVRVMLIGPGGVGKSSLLHGLMNLPLPRSANSTQLAETHTLRATDSYWARAQAGGHWVRITDEDEIKELAQLVKQIQHRKQSAQSENTKQHQKESKFSHPQVKVVIEDIMAECSKADLSPSKNASATEVEVYFRVWDCGGQPVFLNVLPAFLTARTLFLLMFNL